MFGAFVSVFYRGVNNFTIARVSVEPNGAFFWVLKVESRFRRLFVMVYFRCRVIYFACVFNNDKNSVPRIDGREGCFAICVRTVTCVIDSIIECFGNDGYRVFRFRYLAFIRVICTNQWFLNRTVAFISSYVCFQDKMGEGSGFLSWVPCYFSIINVVIYCRCYPSSVRSSSGFFWYFFCYASTGTYVRRCTVSIYSRGVTITTASTYRACGFSFRFITLPVLIGPRIFYIGETTGVRGGEEGWGEGELFQGSSLTSVILGRYLRSKL